MTALDCFVGLLERRGCRPQMNGNGSGKARCPSHDDQTPSLSFKPADRHPGILAHCFVCEATLDVMLRDLGADEDEERIVRGHTAKPEPRATRHFEYLDAEGVLRFRVVRRDPKGFHQERPDGSGGWVMKMSGVELVPYRLPEARAAIALGETLWFAEGEKNVEDLRGLGLSATCNVGGAGKWRDTYSAMLSGLKRAIICVDHDEPGEKHGARVAASLATVGVNDITIVGFVGPKGFDVSDWLDRHAAGERLNRLLDHVATAGRPPGSEPPAAPAAESPRRKAPPLTDTGNAERLVARHGHELRYSDAYGSWIAWDGKVWKPDAFSAIKYTKDTIRAIYTEAAGASDDERQACARWALKSESSRARNAMADLARSELLVTPDAMDSDPWALNVDNGIVDLRTGTLRPHDRAALLTKLAPVEFHADARHEVWDKFLERMVPDPEVREFLQRAAGYSLTGDTTEEKLFFIHGPTASGKSTFIAALKAVMGNYSETCNFETFLESKGGSGATTDLARLPGVRLAVSLEVDEGKKLAVALIKTVTGRDGISARHLYQKAFSYMPAFKLWLVANDKPRANASDNALWRRILMVPFEESLSIDEQDPTVKSTLMADPQAHQAILAWAVRGALLWREEGLNPAIAIQKATSEYRKEQDTVGDFLDDCFVFGAGLTVSNPEVRTAYEKWSLANGERSMSAMALSIRLKHHGLTQDRTSRTRMWHGMRLRGSVEQTAANFD